MAGNVWEWCLNKYDNPVDEGIDRSGDERVLRGGSWIYNRDYCRAASRNGLEPDYRYVDVGFRVCLSSPITDR